MSLPFRVLLYYKYVKLDDHEAYARKHLKVCKAFGLKGRIIVAPLGINGTVSGPVEATSAYIKYMQQDARFADIEYKIDEVEGHVFQKLFVRAKPELVTFRQEYDLDPTIETGKHLAPAEFREAIEAGAILIDARTDYEYDLGHFRGAIRPPVRSFREFPKWVRENLTDLKDKRVLTYCTGGIRCETFTAFLMKEGFSDVSQLHGGIVSYAKDPSTRGELFDGKCYVFDERIAVPVREDSEIVSHCLHCGVLCDRYVNCANLDCHVQHFSCEACSAIKKQACSPECEAAVRNVYQKAQTSSF